jgi:hypothetical protein
MLRLPCLLGHRDTTSISTCEARGVEAFEPNKWQATPPKSRGLEDPSCCSETGIFYKKSDSRNKSFSKVAKVGVTPTPVACCTAAWIPPGDLFTVCPGCLPLSGTGIRKANINYFKEQFSLYGSNPKKL